MSELIWAYEGLQTLGSYLSYILGYSTTFNSLDKAKRNNTTSARLGRDIIENVANLDVAPFILAPITGGGVQGGQRTGVTIRDITTAGDVYTSTVQAVYGVTPFEQVIRSVLDICGLTIVQNDAKVISDIANGVVPGTSQTLSEWWCNTAIKSDVTYITNALAQKIADTFSNLGYFDDIASIKPGIQTGKVIASKGEIENVNIIYACRQACSNWYSINSQQLKEWRERGLSLTTLYTEALAWYNAENYDFSVCSVLDVTGNKVTCLISGFSIPEDAYPITIEEVTLSGDHEGVGYTLRDNTGAQILAPIFTSYCTAEWYGGTHTITYSSGIGTASYGSIGVLIGGYTRCTPSVNIMTSLYGTLFSMFTGSNDVAWKDPGYKVPTRERHTLIDIFPDLAALSIVLPGVIGDILTGVRAIPAILTGTDVLTATLNKVSSIDWDKVISIDDDITIEDPPNPRPPYVPDIPDIPDPTGSANALYTVHTITQGNLNLLGNYLWSSDFISLIEHMFSEPINAVLGLQELHYGGVIPTSSSESIKLGSITATTSAGTVTGNRVSNRYMSFSCGTLSVPEYYGNAIDYTGYTTATLYLPYIGYQNIDINQIMGGNVKIDYGIDVYTGSCVARVFVTKNGSKNELYNFYGQCGCQLPVTSGDYTGLITGALRGLVAGGIAGGVGGALLGGVGGAMGHKVEYGHSNGFNNNVGAMTYQKPILILERPITFNATGYNKFYGHPTNWTVKLSECSGFTRVKDIHLDKTLATDYEKEEITRLLKEGVLF